MIFSHQMFNLIHDPSTRVFLFACFVCVQVALYLCKELPLSLWQPQQEEICVIGAWLLQHPLSAVENRLACVILEGLNWGFNTQVERMSQTPDSAFVSLSQPTFTNLVSLCRMALCSCLQFSTMRWHCWWLKPIRSTLQTNHTVGSYQRESNRWHIYTCLTSAEFFNAYFCITHHSLSFYLLSGLLPCKCPSFGRIS